MCIRLHLFLEIFSVHFVIRYFSISLCCVRDIFIRMLPTTTHRQGKHVSHKNNQSRTENLSKTSSVKT